MEHPAAPLAAPGGWHRQDPPPRPAS